MEKPAVITIRDDKEEIVYMQFIDMGQIDAYVKALGRINEDFVVLETDTGEKFYTMPEYVQNLLRGRKK